MSTDTIQDAKNVLIARRTELLAEVHTLDEAILALNKVLGVTDAPEPVPAPQGMKLRSPIGIAIRDILNTTRRAMHADDIVTLLASRGLTSGLSVPKDTVVVTLRRLREAGEVEALGRNMWIAAGVPRLSYVATGDGGLRPAESETEDSREAL